MLFNKKNITPKITQTKVAILGVNALGLYLAEVLEKLGHQVTLLCSPKKADEYNATDFVFKDSSHLKSSRNNFHFSHELSFNPQVLFIASSPEKLKSDLTLLLSSRLTNSLVVKFCFPDVNNLLSEVLHQPVINVFFDALISRNKNNVTNFERYSKMTFILDEISEEANILRDLFSSAKINLCFSVDEKQNLWEFAGVFLAHNLLACCYNQNIFEFAKKEEGRKKIDILLNEISQLSQADGANITPALLLTKLYEIPSSYIPALQSSFQNKKSQFFYYFSSFILAKTHRDNKKYPLLHQLLNNLYNKY